MSGTQGGNRTVLQTIRTWHEQDGVIYFSVTSDGTDGKQWIERLEGRGSRIGDYAKNVLRCDGFKPTSGVTTQVAIFRGMLFDNKVCMTSKIRDEACKRGLEEPNAEVACLIREMFGDEEIEATGLRLIVAMHKPISAFGSDPELLLAFSDDVDRWLGAYSGDPWIGWLRSDGFAFAVSQAIP